MRTKFADIGIWEIERNKDNRTGLSHPCAAAAKSVINVPCRNILSSSSPKQKWIPSALSEVGAVILPWGLFAKNV
jgi:hypothetical protein